MCACVCVCRCQISWTLTTQVDTIIDFLLLGQPKSLIAMADSANPHLPAWANGYFAKGIPLANIVIIDHFENSVIAAVAAQSSTLTFPAVQA